MRTRWMFLALPLLAACDTTGPDPNWDYEGVIESGHHMVADVGQYAVITCQVDGQAVPTFTGEGGSGPRCIKFYHTIERDGLVVPTHTLYVRDGRVGGTFKARVR